MFFYIKNHLQKNEKKSPIFHNNNATLHDLKNGKVMFINLGEQNSIFNQYLIEIRDCAIQKDSMRFRRNMERMGEIFAYEISKKMQYKPIDVQTPLGVAREQQLISQPVVASILRAGLPIHQGILNVFDRAENAFISAHRVYDTKTSFHISFENISGPSTDGKTIILVDPMLASGASLVMAHQALLKKGTPIHTHIVSVIASRAGINYLLENVKDMPVTVWTGAVDEEMNDKSYIIPGLGDAGDLCYGEKE